MRMALLVVDRDPKKRGRSKPSVFTLILMIALFFGGLFICSGGIGMHLKNIQYENEGIQTEAQLIGYQKVILRSRSGDRPLLRYIDGDGHAHTHLAIEYGWPVGEYGRKTLPSKKILITYLRSNPEEARVDAWCSDSSWITPTVLGIALAILAFYAFADSIKARGTFEKPPQNEL